MPDSSVRSSGSLRVLTAKTEPFDSFWEAPEDIAAGYEKFFKFYSYNYRKHLPNDKSARILVISCGAGYFVSFANRHGYSNVLGIDSIEEKVAIAKSQDLNCERQYGFDFLESSTAPFDLIFCEQELNHLTKDEILEFLALAKSKLAPSGKLILHVLNGANPITGAEALAQNFDHYNTFTEYSLRQVLEYSGFSDIGVFPLNLYVFWKNPLNYVLLLASTAFSLFFRAAFIMYGKHNRLFTKKIAAVCTNAG